VKSSVWVSGKLFWGKVLGDDGRCSEKVGSLELDCIIWGESRTVLSISLEELNQQGV
jgi:hypothetical protein